MRRLAGVLGLACTAVLMLAAPVWAHTGLESSDPPEGAKIAGPLDTVVLTFNRPIDLAGKGVEVLDETGTVVKSKAQVDDETVTVELARPLPAGRYGIRWAVRSGDNHPVRDVFDFAVAGGSSTAAVGPAAERPPAAASTMTAAATVSDAEHNADGLSRALAADPTASIRPLDQGLRAVFTAAALGAIGMLAFLLAVWDGPRREARRLTRLTSRMAGLAVVVVLAQPFVRAARSAGGWGGALAALPTTLTGVNAAGMGLRLVGALLLATGLGALRRFLCTTASPVAGGAVDLRAAPIAIAEAAPAASTARRVAAAPAAVTGALLIVASYALVGHGATVEPRIVAVGATLAHITAAAAWGGGLLGLMITLWTRHRAGRRLYAGLIAARFSVLAAIGVGVAAGAGIALAALKLAAVSALWTTPYGRVLCAKVAIVGIIGGLGAYNHFVVVPQLRRGPGHAATRHLRWIGLIEVGLFAALPGLTSLLVDLAG